MNTYCSVCKKHTDNAHLKELVMLKNKKLTRKSRCAKCFTITSFSDKIKDKYEPKVIVTQFSL